MPDASPPAARDRGETRRHVLIFEPETEGHPREWLQHLVRRAARQDEIVLWLLVSERLRRDLTFDPPAALPASIRILALGERERAFCLHRNLVVSGFSRWWVMRRYLRWTGAEAGLFLFLDHLSLPLALGLGAGGRRIGGILFRPSVHYGGIGPYAPNAKERLRDWRKALLYRLMLLNRSLHAVLTLDPYFPRHASGHYWRGHKVRTLPDPAFPRVAAGAAAMASYRIPDDRVIFLLFGFLAERKGILLLLDTLLDLPADVARRAGFFLGGRVDAAIRETVAEKLRLLQLRQPELWLHLEDRWLEAEEVDALVARSDLVLAPYQRFIGSSGVLLWAARAGKPVLAQDFGLIGRLVRDHGLGLAVDTGDRRAMVAAIRRIVTEGPERFADRRGMRAFVAERSAENFAETVWQSLLG